jgi:CRISPR-associated protein Cas1
VGRVIVLGDDVARVRVRDHQLVAEPRSADGETKTAPIEDLDLVLIDSVSGLTLDSWVLRSLVDEGVAVVTTDATHHPSGILLPLHGTISHGSVLSSQISMSASRTKRAWQTLVKAKIEAQSRVLPPEHPVSKRLGALALKVKSGDPDNYEAQAARIYWPEILGKEVRREGGTGLGMNSALDYGYAVVRALLARSVVGTGLHAAFGVHHSSRTNPFALIDDLIEPLRPIVDNHILSLAPPVGEDLSPALKRSIIAVVTTSLTYRDRIGPMTEVIERYADGYRRYVDGAEKTLDTPVAPGRG